MSSRCFHDFQNVVCAHLLTANNVNLCCHGIYLKLYTVHRMGLYCTKTSQITTLKYSEMEFIDDPKAADGLELTDGCSIIDKEIVNKYVGHKVVSMLARLGGSKCMLVALQPEWIKTVIEMDQSRKREKLLGEIQKSSNESRKEALREALRRNERRNYDAKAVITSSSRKFDFDKFVLEVAVKSETHSHAAFTNKEIIGVAYFHYFSKNEHHLFEQRLQKYAKEWFALLHKVSGWTTNDRILRHDARIFVEIEQV